MIMSLYQIVMCAGGAAIIVMVTMVILVHYKCRWTRDNTRRIGRLYNPDHDIHRIADDILMEDLWSRASHENTDLGSLRVKLGMTNSVGSLHSFGRHHVPNHHRVLSIAQGQTPGVQKVNLTKPIHVDNVPGKATAVKATDAKGSASPGGTRGTGGVHVRFTRDTNAYDII
ncbi:hypothetical protein ACJMK2_022411 [Sinanodonta woodiana]|uniref:Secreted protein n=1 Tax=Sinanodonta woodiana TaxID=1069815 RepID=A0ABD3TIZ7_SINWO